MGEWRMKVGHRVALQTTGIVLGIALSVAALLWLGWVIDFAPNPRMFQQFIAASILLGFVLLACLFAVLVAIWRSDVIEGREVSQLHHPLMWSLGAIAVYFGMASISAVDVFYDPARTWPLLRDPAVRVITGTLVIASIVAPRTWLTVEIAGLRGWPWPKVTAYLLALALVAVALTIWIAITLDGV